VCGSLEGFPATVDCGVVPALPATPGTSPQQLGSHPPLPPQTNSELLQANHLKG